MIDSFAPSSETITSRIVAVSTPVGQRNRERRIETILVPIDFSRDSMRVLQYAVAWAEKFGATIHVANVRPVKETMALQRFDHLVLDSPDTIALLQDRLAEIQEKHDVKFSPDHAHVLAGRAFEEIFRLAQRIEADLIVMPTRGQSGIKRVLLGSTAERVIRYASCPVLIARDKGGKRATSDGTTSQLKIRKILVPVDFSECSLAGVSYAAFLAKAYGAKLRLFHAVFPYTEIFVTNRMSAANTALIEQARQTAATDMKKLHDSKILRGTKCESVIRTGPAIEEICAESARPDIDLVVTSTHGRTGFRHAMIGSVAEHIARYTQCSVISVPSRRTI